MTSRNMAPTRIIQNSVPTRYDPRVTVKPCEPHQIPFMPLDILYQIAKALPQPRQIYNLALASKETWEYLQPALYECEVTYEARLAKKYGGESSTSLVSHRRCKDVMYDSDFDSSVEDGDFGWGSDSESGDHHWLDYKEIRGPYRRSTRRSRIPDEGEECGEGRITLEQRYFGAPMPESGNPFHVKGGLTALHWAAKQGASALPVAQKAIRAALAHQPSYINGVNLQVRCLLVQGKYGDPSDGCYVGDDHGQLHVHKICADLPPPLFLAVSHGNFDVFRALIDGGCDVNLLQGQSVCDSDSSCLTCDKDEMDEEYEVDDALMMSFKIHKECMSDLSVKCDCDDPLYRPDGNEALFCQTVGHVAVRYDQPEMLKNLVLSGLNIQQTRHSSTHLIEYAVMEGNLAAVKALLDHDPSLASRNIHNGTLLHSVPFMRQHAGEEVQDEPMRGIVSFLLEKGAILDAGRDHSDDRGNRLRGRPGLTPLESALSFAHDNQDSRIFTALHAAEFFISMGADWTHCPDSDFWRARARARLFSDTMGKDPSRSDQILNMCLEETVLKSLYEKPSVEYITNTTRKANGLKARLAWGRLFRTIVDSASESPAHGSSQIRAAAERAFSSAFAYLVNLWSKYDPYGSRFCPLAAGGVGRLLLSTGITPIGADLNTWTRLSQISFDEDKQG